MKKLLALICFAFICTLSQAQFTINQSLGSSQTLVTSKGGLAADSALILPSFADTAAANRSSFVKYYAGNMIRVGDVVYVRNATAKKWLPVGAVGTVTSITSSFGITSTPNPIISTGTIKADTTISGLSGKYLRIVDTTNKWVQSVTKLNDSTIVVVKNNSSTNIVLPRGISTIPNLQQVTDSGSTTTNQITIQRNSGDVYTEFYDVDNSKNVAVIENTANPFRANSYVSDNIWSAFGVDGFERQKNPIPYDINFPDTSGTIALSVNGNFADSMGNITLSTSGTNQGLDSVLYNGNAAYNKSIILNDNIITNATATYSYNGFFFVDDTGGNGDQGGVFPNRVFLSHDLLLSAPTSMDLTAANFKWGKYDSTLGLYSYTNIYPKITTHDNSIAIPDSSGVLALSVNGNFADSAGNITLSTSGTNQGLDSVLYNGNTAYNKSIILEETDGTRHIEIKNLTPSGLNKCIILLTDDNTNGEIGINPNFIRVGNETLDTILILNKDKLYFSRNGDNQTVYPSNYYNNQLDTLPSASGVLALSVNGNKADSSGNITISTASGTVTSISQGYGITNSTNPITTTGTIKVDTTISGLSGKYLRIIDTTNKWVNNITRTVGKDSIIFNIGSTRYAIKDSVGTNPAPVGYYGAWQDLVTQTAAADNVGYTMIFRTQDIVPNGISIVNNGSSLPTRITFANSGIYNIQFSSEFQSNSTAIETITIWLRKNGVDVVGSAGVLTTAVKKAGNVYTAIASWNYLLDIVGGEYYELVWSTTNHTDVTMQYYAAGSPPPAAASVILSVTQQSGIMAGTGITAINSLTGAAQTMVTGTDSSDFKIVSTGTSHTFNLPSASASARGVVTTSAQTLAGAKTFSTAPVLSSLTASQILATDGSKNIQSLSTTTYPSLTELSYVKGTTSAVQTQIDNKFTTPTGWTDYFASSTIVGGTGAGGVINYIVMGKILFVQFSIGVTSTATNFSFTLPYTNGTTPQFGLGRGTNNNTNQASVGFYMAASTNVVTLLYSTTNITTPNVWTASNGKSAQGFLMLNIP